MELTKGTYRQIALAEADARGYSTRTRKGRDTDLRDHSDPETAIAAVLR